jgi:hypothetical protein
VNTNTYGAAKGCAVTTFFLTPELKAAGGGVEFLPIGYNDIALRLRASPPDAALFMASPPDAAGACSFGVAVDFLAELWPSVPIRIAHLNPDMPRTRGTPGIPFDSLTAFIEARTPLITLADAADDATRKAIGARVAVLVPDGAAVQAGIGNIPGACMRALAGKKGLRIHSGFVSDWAVDLLEYPTAFVRALTEAGFLACLIPRRSAAAGSARRRRAPCWKKCMRSGGNGAACHAQMYTMGTLLRHGSAAQKQRTCPRSPPAELRLQAFGVTEPTAAPTPRASAPRAARGRHYVVNGQKSGSRAAPSIPI